MAKAIRKASERRAGRANLKEKDAALEASLEAEAQRLRLVFQDITQRFLHKAESEMLRATELAAEIPNNARKRAALQSIIEDIRKLDVKHDKGRIGDLKEIRNLVRKINQRLEELL